MEYWLLSERRKEIKKSAVRPTGLIRFNYGWTFVRASLLAYWVELPKHLQRRVFSSLCYHISHVLNNFLTTEIVEETELHFFLFKEFEWLERPNKTESYLNTVSINKTERITSITRKSAPSLLPSACLECWTWNVTVEFNSEGTKISLGPHLNLRPESSEQFSGPQVWITEYSCIMAPVHTYYWRQQFAARCRTDWLCNNDA